MWLNISMQSNFYPINWVITRFPQNQTSLESFGLYCYWTDVEVRKSSRFPRERKLWPLTQFTVWKLKGIRIARRLVHITKLCDRTSSDIHRHCVNDSNDVLCTILFTLYARYRWLRHTGVTGVQQNSSLQWLAAAATGRRMIHAQYCTSSHRLRVPWPFPTFGSGTAHQHRHAAPPARPTMGWRVAPDGRSRNGHRTRRKPRPHTAVLRSKTYSVSNGSSSSSRGNRMSSPSKNVTPVVHSVGIAAQDNAIITDRLMGLPSSPLPTPSRYPVASTSRERA